MKNDTLKKKKLGIIALTLVVAISTQGCMRNTQTEETTPESVQESLQTETNEETEEDTAQTETEPTVQAVKSEETETEAETEEVDSLEYAYELYIKCDETTVGNYKLQYQLEYMQSDGSVEEGETVDQKALHTLHATIYYMKQLKELLSTDMKPGEKAQSKMNKIRAYIELINELGYTELIVNEDGTIDQHLTELGESINAVYGGN